jgi:phosphatidylinositol-3-phosphatase
VLKALRFRPAYAAAVTAIMVAVGLTAGISAASAHSAAAAHRAAASGATATAARGASAALPKIRHVWIIDLENESFGYTFGANGHKQAPYLSETLPAQGALLPDYYGIGHDSLDNYIAQVSGQAPDYQTGQDCEYFEQFIQFGGENFDKWTKDGQLSGDGCVYPAYVKTIGNQLTAKGLTWKAYEQNMGIDPHRDGTTKTSHGPSCGHPPLNGIDLTDTTGPANDSYATRHDPFMYFHSIINDKAYCKAHVVDLTPLAGNLRRVSTTPNYSFITPDTCADAHDIPLCQDGQKGGLPQANRFLKTWIPRITRSPAYQAGGLIIVTFDESGDDTDAGACCGEVDSLGYTDPSHPNTNEPGLYGPGGGRVGAVLLSRFIKPGTKSTVNYNHYSMLASIENLFGLAHLGDAKQKQVVPFGRDVYTNFK